MPKFLWLAKKANQPKVQRRRPKIKVNFLPLEKGVGLCIIISFISYLVLTNGISTKGYHIEQLEEQLSVLQVQTSSLQAKMLEAQSSRQINDRVANLNLVAADNVTYLTIRDRAVALNE